VARWPDKSSNMVRPPPIMVGPVRFICGSAAALQKADERHSKALKNPRILLEEAGLQ
jgi:hypothetical protein